MQILTQAYRKLYYRTQKIGTNLLRCSLQIENNDFKYKLQLNNSLHKVKSQCLLNEYKLILDSFIEKYFPVAPQLKINHSHIFVHDVYTTH